MKFIFNGKNLPYQVDSETGKVSQPPEKCYNCDNIKKVSQGCSVEDCKEVKR